MLEENYLAELEELEPLELESDEEESDEDGLDADFAFKLFPLERLALLKFFL